MAIDTPARIAIIGAGPIGLEAALYARYLGYDVDLYEQGRLAEHVLRWGHVRMFTPFSSNRSPLGVAALKAQDPAWQPPADDALLTGREFAEQYLIPLSRSDLLADRLHEHTRVEAIGRDRLLKGELAGEERAEADFRLLLTSTRPEDHGRQRYAAADVVIDTSGVYSHPNGLGPGGLPAIGERAAASQIEYGLPDVLSAARERYHGRNVLLVGNGDSAAATLAALVELAAHAPDTWITWIVRNPCDEHAPQAIAVRPDDHVGERARLARLANRLAADDANHVTFFSDTFVEAIEWHAAADRFAVRLGGKHAGEIECDRVIANVGYRADAGLYRELQVGEPPLGGANARLADALAAQGAADMLDLQSCRTQALVNVEPDFYVLGAKSFGHDARFTIALGLAQTRELFTIIGDRAELDLYATMKNLA